MPHLHLDSFARLRWDSTTYARDFATTNKEPDDPRAPPFPRSLREGGDFPRKPADLFPDLAHSNGESRRNPGDHFPAGANDSSPAL